MKLQVDAQQGEPLCLAQIGIALDRGLRLAHPGVARLPGGVEDPRTGEQLAEGDPERGGHRPEHAQRGLVQPPLELAEVGVRHLGALGEVAQGQARRRPLGAQQPAELHELCLPGVVAHGAIFAQRRVRPLNDPPRQATGTPECASATARGSPASRRSSIRVSRGSSPRARMIAARAEPPSSTSVAPSRSASGPASR